MKTPKIVWDAYATKIFCQVCKEETLAGNRPGTTLSSIGYKNLEEKNLLSPSDTTHMEN